MFLSSLAVTVSTWRSRSMFYTHTHHTIYTSLVLPPISPGFLPATLPHPAAVFQKGDDVLLALCEFVLLLSSHVFKWLHKPWKKRTMFSTYEYITVWQVFMQSKFNLRSISSSFLFSSLYFCWHSPCGKQGANKAKPNNRLFTIKQSKNTASAKLHESFTVIKCLQSCHTFPKSSRIWTRRETLLQSTLSVLRVLLQLSNVLCDLSGPVSDLGESGPHTRTHTQCRQNCTEQLKNQSQSILTASPCWRFLDYPPLPEKSTQRTCHRVPTVG